MITCASGRSHESPEPGQDAKVPDPTPAICESIQDYRPIECNECRSGLLHLTPKTGLQRVLATLLFRPQKVWRCHACGRTLDAA
jgi:DNA-directed RNA polymerase subunit RPC12/RpoP